MRFSKTLTQNLSGFYGLVDKVGNLKQKHPNVSHQQKSFYDFTGATYAKKTNYLTPKSLLPNYCDGFYGRRLQNNSISAYLFTIIEFDISKATFFSKYGRTW